VGANPTADRVYVANNNASFGDTVSVIDGAANAVVATVTVPPARGWSRSTRRPTGST
jgi:YVTN family beta-propeller protein